MPKVSIIIPSYNHSKFLIDRLETIFNQTYKDWEAIIIDDKSTDNSVEIIQDFISKNKGFKVKYFIINKNNSGSGYKSWQKGIELATTEFIWIAETDDYSDPEFLQEMISSLESNDAALVFCNSIYVDQNKQFLYDSSKRTKDLGITLLGDKMLNGEVYINKMPFQTYITNGSAVVFRKPKQRIPDEIFMQKQCSDIFLWTYLLRENKFLFINKKLNFFRRHDNSTSILIAKKNIESIYYEKALYINYFNQIDKSDIFIEHYIKHYISKNKLDFFNFKCIRKINKKGLVQRYFYLLTINKIKKWIVNL